MFLRFLFLLLLALNLGVAGWLAFGDSASSMPPAAVPGVPELQLLSEVAGTPLQQSAELAEAPQKLPGAGEQCYALGPFHTQAGMRRAMQGLTPHVSAIQFRREQATASRGWWVYLPSLPSRDQALDAARELSRNGVSDYYVITAGEHENTISLGLYRNPDNAKRRHQAIAAMGFSPSVRERTEQVLEYYIDYAMPAGQTLAWQRYLADSGGLSAKKRRCF